jgi:putative membrane protein
MRNFPIVLGAALLLVAPAMAQNAAPNDAQIAHIVVTANNVDIEAGKLAETQGKSAEVKAFGKQMVTDHSGVNKQATALVHKLKVKPEDNPTSESLKSGGKDNLTKLKSLKGADFDKAYIDHEVAYHDQVIDAIDKTLLPNAKNEELKALIEKVRPTIVAHRDHAKQIQSTLGKG